MAAILDASSTSAPGNTSNLSWTHALGSLSDIGLIIVATEAENNTDNITSATFNGVTMTQVVTNGSVSGSGNFVKMFELHGADVPSAGNYTVTVTYSAFDGTTNSRVGGCASFKGIKGQAAEATASINANGTTPLAVAITTVTRDALVVSAYGSQNSDPSPSSSTGDTHIVTRRPDSGELSTFSMFYKIVTIPASNNVSLTVANPEAEALILASFASSIEGMMVWDI